MRAVLGLVLLLASGCGLELFGERDGAPAGDGAPYEVHEVALLSGESAGHGETTYLSAVVEQPAAYFYAREPIEVDAAVEFSTGAAFGAWPVAPLGQSVRWPGLAITTQPCAPPTEPPEMLVDPCTGLDPDACPRIDLRELFLSGTSCVEHDGVLSPLLFYPAQLDVIESPLEASYSVGPAANGEGDLVLFDLVNHGAEPLAPVMLVYRNVAADCWSSECVPLWIELAVGVVAGIDPSQAQTVEVVSVGFDPAEVAELVAALDLLRERLGQELVIAGLTGDEASSLVAAWAGRFLGLAGVTEPLAVGPRGDAVFLLPRAVNERAVRLDLFPPPERLVRAAVVWQRLGAPAPRG